jgi:large subunit ribosomal protein L23
MNTTNHILRPRITEKATLLSERDNVYTFEVTANATKQSVMDAVRALYKVTPVRVSMVNLPAQRVSYRNRRALGRQTRKALVYLKKGDKIEFV